MALTEHRSIVPDDFSAALSTWLESARPALTEHRYVDAFQTYPFVTFADAPFTKLRVPLKEAKLAIVTSGGLSCAGQPPFDGQNPMGDTSFRVIEGQGPLRTWQIDHGHYPEDIARADYNTVFPLDRVRELVDEGIVGELSDRHFSFVGFNVDPVALYDQSLRAIGSMLLADGVDAVLLVPV